MGGGCDQQYDAVTPIARASYHTIANNTLVVKAKVAQEGQRLFASVRGIKSTLAVPERFLTHGRVMKHTVQVRLFLRYILFKILPYEHHCSRYITASTRLEHLAVLIGSLQCPRVFETTPRCRRGQPLFAPNPRSRFRCFQLVDLRKHIFLCPVEYLLLERPGTSASN